MSIQVSAGGNLMPFYPITLTISNLHSKVPILGSIKGINYPIALKTKSVEDLFGEELPTITITVE